MIAHINAYMYTHKRSVSQENETLKYMYTVCSTEVLQSMHGNIMGYALLTFSHFSRIYTRRCGLSSSGLRWSEGRIGVRVAGSGRRAVEIGHSREGIVVVKPLSRQLLTPQTITAAAQGKRARRLTL